MIHVDDSAAVRRVTLDHGPVNALDVELLDAITDTVEELCADRATRAIVLAGGERAFCAGVDLRRVVDEPPSYRVGLVSSLDRCFTRVLTAPVPTVAAIGGHAIAGGLVLAACCDHRVATTGKARLGVTELAVGVPFPPVAHAATARLVSAAAANRLMLDATLVGTDEALALGLVDELAEPDDVLSRATAVAERRAAIPAAAYALTKRQLSAPVLATARDGATISDVTGVWTSDETTDAIRAFVERM
ncbi:MAG: enoyl-CoA hydratase/isomerase family protein [Actinomycetota bacterium]|nr:enoyl-CoA hydratase/isomerase family protein [Actinomycetota bacterium]